MRKVKCRNFLLLSAAGSLLIFTACNGEAGRHSNAQRAVVSPANEGDPKRLNINTASEDELARLPSVGPKIASRIVEYRMRYGPFRRVEHLMLIQGISETRFRAIRDLIKAE